MSSPVPHYPGVGNQVPLKERVRLGEIMDSRRAVTDPGSRLDDRPEDGFTGLLTETLIDHPNDATFIRGTARATASGGSRFRREPDVEPRRPPGPGSPQPATTVATPSSAALTGLNHWRELATATTKHARNYLARSLSPRY